MKIKTEYAALGMYVADDEDTDPELNIRGHGATPEAAINDLVVNLLAAAEEAAYAEGAKSLSDHIIAAIREKDAQLEASRSYAENAKQAVEAFVEWWDKDSAGPTYPDGMRRDDPGGEEIWARWWSEQLTLCERAHRLGRDVLAKNPNPAGQPVQAEPSSPKGEAATSGFTNEDSGPVGLGPDWAVTLARSAAAMLLAYDADMRCPPMAEAEILREALVTPDGFVYRPDGQKIAASDSGEVHEICNSPEVKP